MTVSEPAFIRRAFTDAPHGQIHYRSAGTGTPILTLHASPGSAKQLVPLIRDLAHTHRVIAPDTAGNGDSDRLQLDTPQITDLAAVLPAFLDSLKLEQVDLYGSHTGAAIAAELAILAPGRIRRLILDGVQILTPDARAEVMAHYAHPFPPDLDGAYLQRAFHFCRDQYVFYPWYDRTRNAQRSGGMPAPAILHDWLVEVLKANETYHLNYRAAFQWEAPLRLPHVTQPTLVCAAENDPLVADTIEATRCLKNASFIPLPRSDAPDFRARRLAAITGFLAA